MELKPIVDEHKKIQFELLSDDGLSWNKTISGKLSITDRFLSTYHKPLQRRMLYTKVDDVLPNSAVIRVKTTGEIYLLGQSRFDVDAKGAYDRLSVIALISNDSGGLVEVFGYLPDDGAPVNDAAELVKTKISDMYLSVEYLSTKERKDTYEDYAGKYLVFSSRTSGMLSGFTFTVKAKHYLVIEAHIDSDFIVSICIEKPDIVQPMVYKSVTASVYSTALGKMVINHTDYKFTGELASVEDKLEGDVFYVYPNAKVFPFTVRQGDYISTPDYDLKIVSVKKVLESDQVKLVCERSLVL